MYLLYDAEILFVVEQNFSYSFYSCEIRGHIFNIQNYFYKMFIIKNDDAKIVQCHLVFAL